MDLLSHVLIGLIIGKIFSIESIDLIFLIIGSILPDLLVFFTYGYYGWSDVKEKYFADKRSKPKLFVGIYDFLHSFLLIIIFLIFGFFLYRPLMYISFGLFIHVLIDIPTHKKYSPRFLFPFKLQFKGLVEWAKLYYSFKSRLVVWSTLGLIYLVAAIIRNLL